MFNGNNSPHELLLTTQWKTNLRNAFENNVLTHIKFSEAQISKIIYFSSSRNYSCCFSNWCRDSKIKIHGSGATTLIISNKEMNEIMKIVQALENSNISLKGFTKTIKNELKKRFFKHVIRYFVSIRKRNVKSRLWIKKEIWFLFILQQTLKFTNIIKMNPDLIEFFQEITYLIK